MKHDEFIGAVQDRAQLDSRGSAEAATRATLETLGERLAGKEPENLAAQLPDEIGLHLRRGQGDEPFGLQTFYERVAQRAGHGADTDQAANQAQAVMAVLSQAVSGGEAADFKEQLPESYEELFSLR